MSDTLLKPEVSEPGTDEPNVAHIVRKDKLTDSYVFGTPIEALCGEVFVPTRDPERYPICEPCKEVAKQVMNRGSN